ncbi:MAG TPA: uroporphyrinogen-III C-methyltransferase [Acidimicrobiales bacterium]|nr:uroporphyrinogen-III C-methyltransferase [Acidimicrobiales bacterium]
MTVYLVGAGPGDPGLITVRGKELLERAEVVVYDRLSAAVFLDMAPIAAERINVGKTPGHAATTQEEINALLVDRGRRHDCVVRLKGGDPFVFGRGGEECEALAKAGVRFEVVPGVTSASAAPAYAGVPLTHRGVSASVTIVTGHADDDTPGNADWDAVARMGKSGGTIVVLMGAAERAVVAGHLLDGGMAGDTPVTAVTWGTRSEQVVVRTTLGGLADADVRAPVTIVIGGVASLADDLAWFRLPLTGRHVVIAAPSGDDPTGGYAGRIAIAANRAGASVRHVVTGTRMEPTDGKAHLRGSVSRASEAAWVTFASAASVEAFAAESSEGFAFGDALVGVVGDATAAAFERHFGRPADLVANPPRGAALAVAIGDAPEEGPREVLVVGAEDGRRELADGLAAAGWKTTPVAAYRLGPPPLAEVPPRDLVDLADLIVCTSSSAATFLVTHGSLITARAPVVTIGPTTAETMAKAGLGRDRVRVAASPAVEDVVAALVESVVS